MTIIITTLSLMTLSTNDTQHDETLYRVTLSWVSLCWLSRFIYCNAECHYAECHYAECHYAEYHYAEYHYAECHYAECRHAEWRGAVLRQTFPTQKTVWNRDENVNLICRQKLVDVFFETLVRLFSFSVFFVFSVFSRSVFVFAAQVLPEVDVIKTFHFVAKGWFTLLRLSL